MCLFFFGNLPAGRVKLAASTCATRVKSRGEAGFLRMASASRGMLGSEFEPRRPLQKSPPIWVVIFSRAPRRSPSCQPAPSRCRGRQSGHFLETASLLPPQAALRRFPRRPLQKENTIRQDGVFFLEQHFCYAKVVACGRVIEREWGNPSKVPPSHSPFLAMCGSADNKTCGQSHKSPPIRVVIFFACSSALTVVSAGSQPLPRPAVRTLPRNRLASSAAGGASALSSMQKKAPICQMEAFSYAASVQMPPVVAAGVDALLHDEERLGIHLLHHLLQRTDLVLA